MGTSASTWLRLGLLALAALLVAGCSRTLTLPKPHPTRGRVLWRGVPVRFAIVNLDPIDGKGAAADAMTREDGTFELRSFANDGTKDGVVPGKYRVTLEEYDVVRLVRKRVPPGVTPTEIPGGRWTRA